MNLIVCALALLTTAIPACAQNPIANPGFEQGLDSWNTYTYQPSPDAHPAAPVVGCVGNSSCVFNLLPPPVPVDGNVCGIQSYESSGNGGVCQSFTWPGGPASISVTARSYSQRYDATPYDSGCLVRMGLVSGVTQNRNLVTTWVVFPWSNSWLKRTVLVPGAGTYTLFIEAYQPNSSAVMSTLWDKVEFSPQPPVLITTEPSAAADLLNPDTSVTVTWTTNVASTSVVDYGLPPSFGQSAGSPTLVTSHSVVVSGLLHTKEYCYRVTSAAPGYLECASDDLSFRTPIWFSDIVPQLNSSGTGIIIDWQTDVQTTSQVEYWIGSGSHTFSPEISTPTTTHEVSITGLTQGSEYSFRVLGRHQPEYSDAASGVYTFWTLPPVSFALANGNFEDIKPGQGHSIYPWVQYVTQDGVSGYHPIDGLVGPFPTGGSGSWYGGARAYEGSYFLGAAANVAYKNGGVFQRVSVNPGDTYTLTARYMTHRSLDGEESCNKAAIGVDPTGGVNPRSTDIKWWSGFSDTNDEQWHSAAVTITGGDSGVATVFLEFQQIYSIQWHVTAIDEVTFGPPLPTSIGALKSSKGSLGGILEDKIVTYKSQTTVYFENLSYAKVYVEEDNRTAGVAVLLPIGISQSPAAGKKLTVVGALGVYYKETALLAESWTVDTTDYPLPKPIGMSQTSLGKSGPNQPAIFPGSFGLCNLGLRVRVFGRVTSTMPGGAGDVTVYIDDGSNLRDGSKTQDIPPVPIIGIRTYLTDKETMTASVGDYIAVTGVLGVEFIDPDHWPDPTDYYVYTVYTRTSDDWDLLWSSPP